MAKEKRPAMPVYTRDILTDEHFVVMSLAERGAYTTLLYYCWQEGSIPDDIGKLAKLCNCPEEKMNEVWPAIRPRFRKDRGGSRLFHRRVELTRCAMEERRLRRVKSGKIGAAKLHGTNSIQEFAKTNACLSISSSSSSSVSNDDVTWLQEALRDYMEGKWGTPDSEIAAAALKACNGADRNRISVELVRLHRSKKRPESSWAWFVTMLQSRFQGGAA